MLRPQALLLNRKGFFVVLTGTAAVVPALGQPAKAQERIQHGGMLGAQSLLEYGKSLREEDQPRLGIPAGPQCEAHVVQGGRRVRVLGPQRLLPNRKGPLPV